MHLHICIEHFTYSIIHVNIIKLENNLKSVQSFFWRVHVQCFLIHSLWDSHFDTWNLLFNQVRVKLRSFRVTLKQLGQYDRWEFTSSFQKTKTCFSWIFFVTLYFWSTLDSFLSSPKQNLWSTVSHQQNIRTNTRVLFAIESKKNQLCYMMSSNLFPSFFYFNSFATCNSENISSSFMWWRRIKLKMFARYIY